MLGTVEAIRLALSGRWKSLAFVCSSGVAAGLGRASRISEEEEEEDASELSPVRVLGADEAGTTDYAGGYTTSKRISEVLPEDPCAHTSRPVQVFRCGMILPHRRYVGQVDEGDHITRLLRGLLATGIAPRSCYRDEVVERHFDGLPVDAVATGIPAIALEAAAGHHNFHVSNARWNDGVLLDGKWAITRRRACTVAPVAQACLNEYEVAPRSSAALSVSAATRAVAERCSLISKAKERDGRSRSKIRDQGRMG